MFFMVLYNFFLLLLLKATYRHAVLKKKGYWAYYSDFPSHLLSTLTDCFHFSRASAAVLLISNPSADLS